MLGAICINDQSSRRELTFEKILLNEADILGETWILKEALCKAGGINYRLCAKRNYELLVRISREYTVLQLSRDEWEEEEFEGKLPEDSWIRLDAEMNNQGEHPEEDRIRADCYLIGRYKDELLSMGRFNDAVGKAVSPRDKSMVRYMEQMLLRQGDFYNIYDCTQPILVYRGDDLCYKVLDSFAESLGRALENLGQSVEYFDRSKQDLRELAYYINRRFKAVIGMQTYLFSLKWMEGDKIGRFIQDSIIAPKYHFIFDHPILARDLLIQIPDRTCVLTSDRNYAEFIRNYYGLRSGFLPPAGDKVYFESGERDYDVVFLGSYRTDLLETLKAIRRIERKRCYFLNRYIAYMRKNLDITPEKAFKKTLEYYGISSSKEEFLEMFHKERWIIFYLADYYRNNVVELLVKSGITLHVFGDSWKQCPMIDCPQMVWHPAAIGKAALEVYARAKISLNVMTWHKDGFTERIANSMLQGAVAVTDRTTYLEENFVDEEELLIFHLGFLEELPDRINALLKDEKNENG